MFPEYIKFNKQKQDYNFINFYFMPNRTTHFGGYFKSAVKSVKFF